MLAATLSAVAPTPGGLGAMEAALVTALVRLGVETGAAVASVLTFRLATFWLPIPLGAWVLRRGRRDDWL
jgi:undecaprenyl-diphosphatase